CCSSVASLRSPALGDAADRAEGAEAALARPHREQPLAWLGEQSVNGRREVRRGDGGARGGVGGEGGLERAGAVRVERQEFEGPEREPSRLERWPLSAGAKREQVQRKLEVGDQHLGAGAVPSLAALVVENAGAGFPAVNAVQRAAEVDRPLAGQRRGELEVRAEPLLGRGGAQAGQGGHLPPAEDPLPPPPPPGPPARP